MVQAPSRATRWRSTNAQEGPEMAAIAADEREHAAIWKRLDWACSVVRAQSSRGRRRRRPPAMSVRDESWHRAAGRSGALRAAIFGINDGLVSNLALVMGVAGASDRQPAHRARGRGRPAGRRVQHGGRRVHQHAEPAGALRAPDRARARGAAASDPRRRRTSWRRSTRPRASPATRPSSSPCASCRTRSTRSTRRSARSSGLDPDELGLAVGRGVATPSSRSALGRGHPAGRRSS